MTQNNSYIESIEAKNGMKVAVFKDGKTFYSKYNPLQDANNFCANESFLDADFLCIAGLGNGYHINVLSEKFPKKKILVFEDSKDSVEYLFRQDSLCEEKVLEKLNANPNIIFSSLETLENDIVTNYFPAIYKNFCFVSVRSWENYHIDKKEFIKKIIQDALKRISDDFSVQCRFAKVWQKNIFSNFKVFCNSIRYDNGIFDNKKKPYTAIVAAGSSIDEDIELLERFSGIFNIISTDTAFPVLLKKNIIPDFVVSIDTQVFSHEHFVIDWNKFGEKLQKNTVFVMDLCSDSSSVKKIMDKGCQVLFFKSGHPLCQEIHEKLISKSNRKVEIPSFSNGRGTVTSTCFSFAESHNFDNIVFFGADFSFLNGKPYCKSTYLEKKWLNSSNQINNLEKQNTALMFRTKLITDSENNCLPTTELLNEYCQEQIRMIKDSNVKNVFCASGKANKMKLEVLKYDKMSYLLKKMDNYDTKLELKYDKNSDIKYDINYDILSDTAFLPYKAWKLTSVFNN